jgi:hypothetical protein
MISYLLISLSILLALASAPAVAQNYVVWSGGISVEEREQARQMECGWYFLSLKATSCRI